MGYQGSRCQAQSQARRRTRSDSDYRRSDSDYRRSDSDTTAGVTRTRTQALLPQARTQSEPAPSRSVTVSQGQYVTVTRRPGTRDSDPGPPAVHQMIRVAGAGRRSLATMMAIGMRSSLRTPKRRHWAAGNRSRSPVPHYSI